ncbi:M28 family peptidase [Alteromonas halophila]|uniref:Aminopeptidase n=1 Tax=Alteromonas halophila TaxID=516698 RepID=A0A918N1A8_9ALTE|nr:M28 family peptidase [Alteromonas halophila]GGW93488.1 aminopeptidase [Alteromonas halophila]
MSPRLFYCFTALLALPLMTAMQNTASAEDSQAANVCPALNTTELMHDVTVLASDEFAGREPATRGHEKARQYITKRFAEVPLSAFQSTFIHPFEYGSSGRGTNIIGYAKGTQYSSRYIVITAHYDHLGYKGGHIYNGADDNASGVAAMLALAQQLALTPPLHSVIFIATDAEEEGLHGAHAFFRDLPVASSAIALNINIDMVGQGGNRDRLLLIHDGIHSYLKKPLTRLKDTVSSSHLRLGLRNARSQHSALTRSNRENWQQASDYAVFGEKGIPFIHIGSATHNDYHQPTDTVGNIDTGFFTQSAGIAHCVFRALDKALPAHSS